MKDNSKGFAQIIIIIILLILVGGAAYYFGSQKGNILPVSTPTPTLSTTTVPNPTVTTVKPTADPTVDWKTYVIPTEKLTVKYPNDWILTTVEGQNQTVLTSPNNFKLNFRTGLDGLGGGCDPDCQSHNLNNVVLGTLNFYKVPLYVVVNGLKDDSTFGKASIGFNVIPEKTCWMNLCYGFAGKNSPGEMIINGGYAPNTNTNLSESPGLSVSMPISQFTSSTDVKIALSILEKLSY